VRIEINVFQLVAFHVDKLVLDRVDLLKVGANPRNKGCLTILQVVYFLINVTVHEKTKLVT